MDLSKVLRRNIMALAPYSCARDEFKGEASVYIDANESPYENGVNRYPDPLQAEVKKPGQWQRRGHRPYLSHLLRAAHR